MTDRDAEIAEQYAEHYDTEHGAQLMTAGGGVIQADSIRGRLSRETQAAIDAKLTEWRESELAGFVEGDVLNLGKHVI